MISVQTYHDFIRLTRRERLHVVESIVRQAEAPITTREVAWRIPGGRIGALVRKELDHLAELGHIKRSPKQKYVPTRWWTS